MSDCYNLQVLILSYHFISKIENLDELTRLKELDLSENRIQRFEGLSKLTLLETLNLTGNLIKELPKAALEHLKCLKTLKISKNKVPALSELGNLAILPSLENLYIAGNPVCENEDFKLYVVYYIGSLESLDGDIVNTQLRQKATKKHAGPSPEVWVVRENLVSFRRNLAEKDLQKKELAEEIEKQERKIDRIRAELEGIERNLEKSNGELENIEKAIMNTPESQDSRKQFMREEVAKVENLQKASVDLQQKLSEARTLKIQKHEQLDGINRQLESGKPVDRQKLIEEIGKLQLDLEELEDTIYGYEQEYNLTVESYESVAKHVADMEEEIFRMSSAKEQQKRPGHKKESSFAMDSETLQVLKNRKEEIISDVPKLKVRKNQLVKEVEVESAALDELMLEYRDIEREILEVSRQISDCEDYLHKISTPSPMRNRSNTKQMWESVKSLWVILTDNPWEFETDDIQKGIIRWAEHMKEHVSRIKTDYDSHSQLLTQQKLDQSNISHLNLKIQELSEQLLSRSKLVEENDKLLAKIDAFKEKEKKWTFEHSQLIEKIRALESEDSILFVPQSKNIEVLKLEQESIKASMQELIQKTEKDENELKSRINKLSQMSEAKSKELQDLGLQCEEKRELVQDSVLRLKKINEDKSESIKAVESLKAAKIELEQEIKSLQESVKMTRPLKQFEEERDKAFGVVKGLFQVFNIEIAEPLNTRNMASALEERLKSVQEDLNKIEKFKLNKRKFVEMYESNTKELQEKWEELNKAKEEFEYEKIHVESIKNDKRNLDEQMKQLVLTTKDLQRVKNNLERETIKYEEHLTSLKQSVSTFETLKQKELQEYSKIQALNEAEMRKIEDSIQELKALKSQVKDLKSEKQEIEFARTNAINHVTKLEENKKQLEDEIRANENQIFRLSNKMTEEQVKVQKDLEKAVGMIESKQKEINNFEISLRSYENQIGKVQEQVAIANNRLAAVNEEINEKESMLKERKNELREIESKYLNSEAALDRSRKETEMLNQTFASKKQRISAIELDIVTKSSELEKINIRYEQGNSELQNIERQISRIKSDLMGIEQIITSKNNEYNQADSNLKSRQQELREIDRALSEKRFHLERAEQEYQSIHNQAKTEEEAIYIFQEESKSIQLKISKLNEVLKRVESQKSSVLKEIEGINARVVEDEMRHRNELENLRNAVSNGESTLRQLMESVQRCRNKLSSDKEELSKVQDEISKLLNEKDSIAAFNQDLANESSRLRSEINKIKEEEDTALVLLALSGHKIDDRVKQRITSLCRSATELELLKASLQESANKEVRESISETRMKQHSRLDSYENLSMFDKDSRTPLESRMDEFKVEKTSFYRNV